MFFPSGQVSTLGTIIKEGLIFFKNLEEKHTFEFNYLLLSENFFTRQLCNIALSVMFVYLIFSLSIVCAVTWFT